MLGFVGYFVGSGAPFISDPMYTSSSNPGIEHLIARGKGSPNTLPKVVGFLQVLRFLSTRKVTEWARINSSG